MSSTDRKSFMVNISQHFTFPHQSIYLLFDSAVPADRTDVVYGA